MSFTKKQTDVSADESDPQFIAAILGGDFSRVGSPPMGNKCWPNSTNQTRLTEGLQSFFGIAHSEIPCVVFYRGFEHPERKVLWPLKGMSRPSLIHDFRNLCDRLNVRSGEPDLWLDEVLKVRHGKVLQHTKVQLQGFAKEVVAEIVSDLKAELRETLKAFVKKHRSR